ncbi:MSMEG_0567/Sll0786 family nitrogen starvation N-acetyltransferase [Marinomonas sp. 5E14-1]|uniref:MSMEG_0567/Sll0786 family nitrogen starvation N-acetyltransferase n=1 Tax=Marinomonas sp. 5E14-1 TaxID=3153922 RepID=UPI0032652765
MNDKSHKKGRVFQVKWATNDWEIEQAKRIRQAVFCEEQGIFEEHDRDEIDTIAQPLIVTTSIIGMPEEVVGTVRIHQSEPGLWWGARLAVKKEFRRQGVLGASLIKLAVSSANTIGCHTFLATVQEQNEVLFRRLNWDTIGYETIHGMKHAKMQADLQHYPALDQPELGFWVTGRPVKTQSVSAYLLGDEVHFNAAIPNNLIEETAHAGISAG